MQLATLAAVLYNHIRAESLDTVIFYQALGKDVVTSKCQSLTPTFHFNLSPYKCNMGAELFIYTILDPMPAVHACKSRVESLNPMVRWVGKHPICREAYSCLQTSPGIAECERQKRPMRDYN